MSFGYQILGFGAGGEAFTGLLDTVIGALAAYSVRRLSSAYSGSLVRVRRSSDNAEQDIGYDGSGNLDTAAMESFVGANDGFGVTWYDQSGNGRDTTQATASLQPRIVDAGTTEVDANGKTTLNFNLDKLVGSTDDVEASDFAVLAVAQDDDAGASEANIVNKNNKRAHYCGLALAGWDIARTSSQSRFAFGAHDGVNCKSDNYIEPADVLHAIVATFDLGVQATLRLDGVERKTLDLSTVGDMTNTGALEIGDGNTYWIGLISEIIIVPLADYAAVEADMISTYST